MDGREFIRRLRRLARRQGVECTVDPARGRGSHVRVTFAGRVSIVPQHSRDLPTGTLNAICRQLGIRRDDL